MAKNKSRVSAPTCRAGARLVGSCSALSCVALQVQAFSEHTLRVIVNLSREKFAYCDLACPRARATADLKSHGALCVVDMSDRARAQECGITWEEMALG